MVILIFLAILYVFIGVVFGCICIRYLVSDEDAFALIVIFWPFVLLFMIIFNVLNSEVLPFEEQNCKRFKKKDCKTCDQIKELYPGSGLKYCELLIKVNGLCMLED